MRPKDTASAPTKVTIPLRLVDAVCVSVNIATAPATMKVADIAEGRTLSMIFTMLQYSDDKGAA